jgi:hypothetical protein
VGPTSSLERTWKQTAFSKSLAVLMPGLRTTLK